MALDPNQQLLSTSSTVPISVSTQSSGNPLTTDTLNGSSSVTADPKSSSPIEAQAARNPNSLFTKPFPDFNNDGKSDIFWRNPDQTSNAYSTTNNAVWLMNGNSATGAYIPTLDNNWDFSFADFNGDGKSDIFWNNSATGENKIWLMDGSTITNSTDASQTIDNLGPAWTPTIADFNGDGKTDIFWRNTQTGDNQIWLMDGTSILSKNTETTLGTQWSSSIVDFNGDGKADILWRNTQTGENLAWVENDAAPQNFDQTFLPQLATAWTPYTGDFNGDGKSDILWRNTQTGENAYWIMDGTNATGYSEPTLGTAWTPRIGDFNGDGKTDIFWRNTTTGDNAVWISDSTGTKPTGYTESSLPTVWQNYSS